MLSVYFLSSSDKNKTTYKQKLINIDQYCNVDIGQYGPNTIKMFGFHRYMPSFASIGPILASTSVLLGSDSEFIKIFWWA